MRKRKFTFKGHFNVYILECSDGSYYTGHTNDLDSRLKLHQSGKGAKYVRAHQPFKLVYTKKFRYFKQACAEEIRIKKLDRLEKERLVSNFNKKLKSVPDVAVYEQ